MLRVAAAGPRSARQRARRDAATVETARAVALGAGAVGAVAAACLGTGAAPAEPATLALGAAGFVVVLGIVNVRGLGAYALAPSALWGAALATFHLGLIVPVALGLAEAPRWLETETPADLAAAMLAVVLAVAALEVGLLAGWQRLGRRRRPAPLVPAAPPAGRETGVRPAGRASALHSGALAVAALGLGAVAVNVWTIGVDRFLGASYGYELYAATDSRLLQTGLFWLLPASALVALAGARPGRERRRARLVVAAVGVTLLWVGDRGGALALGATALVLHTAVCGPVARRTAVAAALAALVLVPLIAAVRQVPRNAIGFAALGEAAGSASPLGAVTEMGWTLRPLAATLALVPAHEPFRRGGSYLVAAERVLPNLGLTRASGEWSSAHELSPSDWITFTVAPWTHAAYGGLGYSAVAEPWLNFGVAGIAVVFALLGVLLGRLDVALAARPTRRVAAFAAVVLMPLFLMVRNDAENFVRPAVWGLVLVELVERAHGVRRSRGSRAGDAYRYTFRRDAAPAAVEGAA